MARARGASVEDPNRPDFRLKVFRDMLPDPPEHLSTHQKRQWRITEWDRTYNGGLDSRPRQQESQPSQRDQPQPKAKAEASYGKGVLRTKTWTKWFWQVVRKRAMGRFSFCCFFLAFASLGGSSGLLSQLASFTGAALSLGETTSMAAGQAMNLTGIVASSASQMVVAATSNGLTAAANAWRGIDILDLQTQRCSGLVTVDGDEVLREWFASNFSTTLIPCLTAQLQEQMLAAASSVNLGMPTAQTATEHLELAARFDALKVWGQLLPSGKIQITFEMVRMEYALAWSNPLWAHLSLDVQSERTQVLQALRRTLLELPRPSPVPSLPEVEMQVALSWPLARAKFKAWLRGKLLDMNQRDFFSLEATLRGMGAVNA